jgi:hypothetical protein
MTSEELAKYIEATNGVSKPWLLIQLRLAKLKESRAEMSAEEYEERIAELHLALMNLGEWWLGQEEEVF